MTKVLFGQPVAEKIYSQLELKKPLTMAVVLVGEEPASLTYVEAKKEMAQKLKIGFRLFHLSKIARENQLFELIDDLNKNKYIDAIVVQLPLPEDFDTDKILKEIHPDKDIDGFSGKYPAPTPSAILEILEFYGISLHDKKIVIVGFGRLVGKPLAKLLQKQDIKAIICTSHSNIASETLDADIIISATGVPGLIKPEMISEKAVIIDAGTAESKGKIRGDVDPRVYDKVSAYTPTPGGVGPVTVACLMRNLIEAAKKA